MSGVDILGTLSTVYTAAREVCRILKSVKDAPSELQKVQDDAARLRTLLKHIIRMESLSTNGLSQDSEEEIWFEPGLVERARRLTEIANRFVERVTKTNRESDVRQVRRLMWPLHASEAKELADQFQAFYVIVSAVYSMKTSYSMQEMRPVLVGVEQTLQANHEEIKSMLTHALARVSCEQADGRHQYFDGLSPFLNDRRAPAFSQANRVECAGPKSTSTFKASRPLNLSQGFSGLRCSGQCRCRCHQRPSRFVPAWLVPWVGNIRVSQSFLAALMSSTRICDDTRCIQTVECLATMRWLLPTWYAEVECKIRLHSRRIQFIIQTPRVVESLYAPDLVDSLDILKMKLSTREITVNDVDALGRSILHVLVDMAVLYPEKVHETIQYILDCGAPLEWEYNGLTAVEFGAHLVERIHCVFETDLHSLITRQSRRESFVHTIAQPHFGLDQDDVWQGMRHGMEWTDLHYILCCPQRPPAETSVVLASMLALPDHSMASQLNKQDILGDPPLHYAISSCPAAVDILLRAGANPHVHTSVMWFAARWGRLSAIRALIRAGADIAEPDWIRGAGRTALHEGAADQNTRVPLELYRHGGHMPTLGWTVQDGHGRMPMDVARAVLGDSLPSKEVLALFEILRTRKIPIGAQCIDASVLAGGTPFVADLRFTSLIAAALDGNADAVGELIGLGAMVNERDAAGRTLLHLVGMGIVPNGYRVAVEIVRHGGYGVAWDALTADGQTAEELAAETLRLLQDVCVEDGIRREAMDVLELYREQCLPDGEDYIYPCMHPEYCRKCSSRNCLCTVPGFQMPGGFC